ncbi:hypothetical protein M9H77_36247 [Catharanthus roseus]|uniref:Uncharacterized protein n=1 Tax=Catharanthus roseus TaxID=4058 RepID=A0ACB9ZR94_CATRO|nr:hypothetical protein M9H77_36247 [Catharanthus roseus]
MLNWLRRELGRMIIHYPNRNHNGIKVAFILVCLHFAARYCHREKVSFRTFSIHLCTYLKSFFRVTHPLQTICTWGKRDKSVNHSGPRGPFSKWLHRELSRFIRHRPDLYCSGSNMTFIVVHLG